MNEGFTNLMFCVKDPGYVFLQRWIRGSIPAQGSHMDIENYKQVWAHA